MNAVVDRPESAPEVASEVVDSAPGAVAVRAVSAIRTSALARFVAAEAHVKDMAEKYRDVAWDASTSKGLKECKDARHELREEGRYAIQRIVEATKAELNDLKGDVDEEGARLIAIIKPAETEVDAVIKKAEKAEKAEKEAARIAAEAAAAAAAEALAAINKNIDNITAIPLALVGRDSATIKRGLDFLAAQVIDELYGEHRARAAAALGAAMEKVNTMLAAAVAAEAQAVELAAMRAKLAAAQALIDAAAAEQAAKKKAAAEAAAAAAAAPAPEPAPAPAVAVVAPTAAPRPTTAPAAPAPTAVAPAAPAPVAVAPAPAPAETPAVDAPTYSIGAIKEAIFGTHGGITAAFLAELGAEGTPAPNGRGVIYSELQFKTACAGLVRRIRHAAGFPTTTPTTESKA